jgi:hypothetical protein
MSTNPAGGGAVSGWREVLAESQYDWDMGIVGGAQPTWAQYRQLDPENAALYETCGATHAKALLSMPSADRIALARELLEGTGMVVARDVGPWDVGPVGFAGHKKRADGWNACRAAMMGDAT